MQSPGFTLVAALHAGPGHRRQQRDLQRGERGAAAAAAVPRARAAGRRWRRPGRRNGPSRLLAAELPRRRGAGEVVRAARRDRPRTASRSPGTASRRALEGADRQRQLLRRAARAPDRSAAASSTGENEPGAHARGRARPRALAASASAATPASWAATVQIDREPRTVVGVDAARLPLSRRAPRSGCRSCTTSSSARTSRGAWYLTRRRPARAGRLGRERRARRCDTIAARLAQDVPGRERGRGRHRDAAAARRLVGDARTALFVLLGAVRPRAAGRVRQRREPAARARQRPRERELARARWRSAPGAAAWCASSWPRALLLAVVGGVAGRRCSRAGAGRRAAGARQPAGRAAPRRGARSTARVLAFARRCCRSRRASCSGSLPALQWPRAPRARGAAPGQPRHPGRPAHAACAARSWSARSRSRWCCSPGAGLLIRSFDPAAPRRSRLRREERAQLPRHAAGVGVRRRRAARRASTTRSRRVSPRCPACESVGGVSGLPLASGPCIDLPFTVEGRPEPPPAQQPVAGPSRSRPPATSAPWASRSCAGRAFDAERRRAARRRWSC